MDEFLTKIIKNETLKWEIVMILVSAACSALCGVITQNMLLTGIYIGITAVIDIVSEIESEMEGLINWKKIVGGIFEIKNPIKYTIFTAFSLSPVTCGIVKREIIVRTLRDIPSFLFVNIFPNVCGALIVCSLVSHISKLNEKQFVSALIQSKKGLFNVIIRASFFACYLNAVSYKANDSWKLANCVNSVYLFFIVSCGAIAIVSFLSRLVDDQPFPYTVKEVFPTWTLFFSLLFLFSCGAGPLIARVGKHEPFLLLLNTITTTAIFACLLWFVDRKTNKSAKAYPIGSFSMFLLLAILNCVVNFYHWDRKEPMGSQLVSGFLILGIAVVILSYLGHLQSKNLKKAQEDKMEKTFF